MPHKAKAHAAKAHEPKAHEAKAHEVTPHKVNPHKVEEKEPEPVVKGFYQGDRVRGQRHGFGSYYFYNGARYTGDWHNGLKHGSGKFVYPDGSVYEGMWWENMKHGYGRYHYPNGDVYDGQWQLDQRHGTGIYFCAATNNIYQGYWQGEKLTGPTQVIMRDAKYCGHFTDDHAQGPGMFVLPNNLSIFGKHSLRGKKQTVTWVTKGFGPTY